MNYNINIITDIPGIEVILLTYNTPYRLLMLYNTGMGLCDTYPSARLPGIALAVIAESECIVGVHRLHLLPVFFCFYLARISSNFA